MRKEEALAALHLDDAFADFVPDPTPQLWGWNGERQIFSTAIGVVRPGLIVEVGSWLGQSAVTMARALTKYDLKESSLICIDTWLGSLEHWQVPQWRAALKLEYGYPTLYRHFLSNMVAAGVADRIVPLPMTSRTAAHYLASAGLKAECIYIDGSHDEQDVYDDLCAYWELLAPEGILFGDDWDWPGVRSAVTRFSREKNLTHHIDGGVNWIFRKRA